MKREISLYPLQLLPRLRLAGLYRMTGRIPEAGKIESDVKELMRLRGIDGGVFREILKNPDYDLRPWDAPGWNSTGVGGNRNRFFSGAGNSSSSFPAAEPGSAGEGTGGNKSGTGDGGGEEDE